MIIKKGGTLLSTIKKGEIIRAALMLLLPLPQCLWKESGGPSITTLLLSILTEYLCLTFSHELVSFFGIADNDR